jgi:dTDP-4-amino-4,6-dideoxygalactose transaminase
MVAAFLWAQLESLEDIQTKRKKIWERYYSVLKSRSEKKGIRIFDVPDYATQNGHMFYLVCKNVEQRTSLMKHLKENNIDTVFHYLSLHLSQYYKDKHDGRALPYSDLYTDCLVRLPMFNELTIQEVDFITSKIMEAPLK